MATERTRRGFLASGAAEVAVGLADCIGLLSGSQDPFVGLKLASVIANGSPGGTVVVAPAGQVSLFDIFGIGCPPCRTQMDNLVEVTEEIDGGTIKFYSITRKTDDVAIKKL